MKILGVSDKILSHHTSDVFEQTSDLSPTLSEGSKVQSSYIQKGLELPLRTAMVAGEMKIHPDEVCDVRILHMQTLYKYLLKVILRFRLTIDICLGKCNIS